MQHRGTILLKTERLTLRRFEPSDAEACFHNWTSDEKVTEFLRWNPHVSIKETARVLSDWISEYDRPDFYQWAIVPKDIGEPIGTISVVNSDDRTQTVHIGYCIGSKWWYRGIMSEALAAVIGFFFTEVRANRIESQHDPDNPRSGIVMKKCGMKYEGTLRQADFSNRGIVDACVYGLLRDEWISS